MLRAGWRASGRCLTIRWLVDVSDGRARGSARLPATHTPGTVVRPLASATTQCLSSMSRPTPTKRSLFGTNLGGRTSTRRGTVRPDHLDTA